MTALQSWAVLAALGAFHGLNPAMGWLFAVALGLQRRSRGAVLRSLGPIALGHALSIALVLVVFGTLRAAIAERPLRLGAGVLLLAFAVYGLVRRHTGRAGMQAGFGDLTLWSFLMASGHGAGIMLLPVLMRSPAGATHGEHFHSAHAYNLASSWIGGAAVVAVHTIAMLAVAGAIALAVYEWFGLAFLRRGWINFDFLWSGALALAGLFVIVPALL